MSSDLHQQASAAHAQGRFAEAEAAYRTLIESDTVNSAPVLNDLANLLKETRRLEEAESCYRQALILRPGYPEALNNLGNLLKDQKFCREAEACFRNALNAWPHHPDIRNNLGVLLHEMGRCAEAEQAFSHVLRQVPDHIEALNNLGNLLKDTRHPAEAETAYRRILALRPDHPEARWNLSLLLLLRGEYREAWPLYESRYDPRRKEHDILYPSLPTPRWKGEPLEGKHLLVGTEQGMGDEIQLCRFIQTTRQRFSPARITLLCKHPLKPLLQTVSGIDNIMTTRDPVPPHDVWCFPGSLPFYCHTTLDNLPNRLPYLSALPDRLKKWEQVLSSALKPEALRVGLVWAGNRHHKNDQNRSLPSLQHLAPLWCVPGIQFISLQHGESGDPALKEATTPPEDQPLLPLGSQVQDFADTAALVARMDLVICVDTAIAHLAGALAKPCWVMLPYLGNDWRWLEDRHDSPWYPGIVRLFRQRQPASWPAVIEEITRALMRWRTEKNLLLHRLAELPESDIHLVRTTIAQMQARIPPHAIP